MLRRELLAAALAAPLAGLSRRASAHPVRVGRYAEIPYGVRPEHPAPTEGGGPTRSGRLPGPVPAREPTLRFERALRQRRPRGPIIAADGTLYLGTFGGLVALDASGEERWVADVGPMHAAPSLLPSDELIAVLRGGQVAVVTPRGGVRRTADLRAPARGTPLVLDDGSFVIGTVDRRVVRLDTNLRTVFAVDLPEGAAGTASRTAQGVLVVPAGNQLSLLADDGSLLRTVALGDRPTTAAAIADDGTLWVMTTDGALHAIDPSGRVRSRTDLGSRHYDGASAALGRDGAVRVPTLSEGLVCVGPSGTERWRLPSPAGYNAPASIGSDDATLVIDRSGRLIAVNAHGTERWRVVLSAYSFSAPVLGPDGAIYLTTERGAIQCWEASSLPGPVTPPAPARGAGPP